MMAEHRILGLCDISKQTPHTSKSILRQIDEKRLYICPSLFDYKSQSVVTPKPINNNNMKAGSSELLRRN